MVIDAQGPHDNDETNTLEDLYSWTNEFPINSGETQETVCEGTLVDTPPSGNDCTYCESEVYPKKFSV